MRYLIISMIAMFCAYGATPGTNTPPKKTGLIGADLFPDEVIARGKGFEIKRSELDEAYLAYKANRAAAGQNVPPSIQPAVELQMLDRLIATQLFLQRATVRDKESGKEISQKFIEDLKTRAPSEAAFNRQLLAEGTTAEKFTAQVYEQAVVKAVIDRELKDKILLTPDQLRKYYDDNPDRFMKPEQFRVRQIQFLTRDLTPAQRIEKRDRLERILQRLKLGEKFEDLVRENSEDTETRERGGEYVFARGQMPPEFEAAASSLKLGAVSDVVTSQFGYHLIKLEERLPAEKHDYNKVRDLIRETLAREEVQKQLPDFVERLKKEAGTEIVDKNLKAAMDAAAKSPKPPGALN